MFVDEARIAVKAGDGGKGCESFYRDLWMRYPRPDGGNGGRGGDIIFIADKSVRTLLDFRYKQHYTGQRGGNASSKGKKGKEGAACILKVPIGTMIRNHETGLLIKDLAADQQQIIVVRGGRGGRGNANNKMPLSPGEGESLTIDLELKLVADVGIIGFPNAGKSTLISTISKVKSKIANYPFTTRNPILGFVSHKGKDFIVADLPGIIEGAHKGRGLGDRFLRHVERNKMLVHLIDMAGSEGRDPLEDYEKLNFELRSYDEGLLLKEKIVVANKMDLPEAKEHLKRFKKKYKKVKVIEISAIQRQGLGKLLDAIIVKLC